MSRTGSSASITAALIVNPALLGLFAVQHSLMARQGFKRWWTRIIPPRIERSTFVLAASLALDLLYWKWILMPGAVREVHNATGQWILLGLSLTGWLLVVTGTFLIDHFDLFGLRQAYMALRVISDRARAALCRSSSGSPGTRRRAPECLRTPA